MSDWTAELVRAMGDRVVLDHDVMGTYRRDLSMLTAAGHPAAVVRAQSVTDVVTTLQTATRHAVPVVTRGAGTGLSGAANALDGCIVLTMDGMDAIVGIDDDRRTATVQPGVINQQLADAARERGLWYVPDPGSRAISTIGGNLATNAGGICCAKYGVTGDHVASAKAILADGRPIEVGAATRKNAAGLDLLHLLVGSEGTLAVIVEATVRLRVAPRDATTLVAFFATSAQAIDAVLGMGRVAEPSMVELMDRTTIAAVEAVTRMGLNDRAAAMLCIQCDGRAAAAEINECVAVCEATGATETYATNDPIEGESFLAARRMALPALERLGTALLDDVAVPVPTLPALLAGVEQASAANNVVIGTFGHAADGNLHPTIVYDAADHDASQRAQRAFDAIVRLAVSLGGTITGEHGVGTLKLPYVTSMVGAVERDLMTRVKAAFDPAGILNPGKAF